MGAPVRSRDHAAARPRGADTASLRFLASLARRISGYAILLVVGIRPHEPGMDESVRAAISQAPGALILDLSALSVMREPVALDDAVALVELGPGDTPSAARTRTRRKLLCQVPPGGREWAARALLAAGDSAPCRAAAARAADRRRAAGRADPRPDLEQRARPRRTRTTGLASLTPAERRSAERAALGRTNREIAEELFVTPRPVAFHLGTVYRKLAISGRGELAGVLRGER